MKTSSGRQIATGNHRPKKLLDAPMNSSPPIFSLEGATSCKKNAIFRYTDVERYIQRAKSR